MRGLAVRVLSLAAGVVVATGVALGPVAASGPIDWLQWGQNPQHQGFVDVAGQNVNRALADIVYDPNVPAEQASTGGDLLAHYQAPLLHGNDVFMEFKTGPFTDADHWYSQTWHEKRLHWEGSPAELVQKWDFASDWKPEPNGPGNGQSSKQDRLGLGGWEPVFHAVLANDFVYVPGAGGTLFKLNPGDGSVASRINPFGVIDPQTFVAGVPSADDQGNIYYNVIKLDATDPWGGKAGTDVVDSWLVKASANDSVRRVSYKTLVSGAPTRCTTTYNVDSDLPWPNFTTTPPQAACGSQRVGLNVAPAISPDGTVYTVSRAHLRSRYSYLLAVNADLTPKWQASLRGHLNDGCGVILPNDNGGSTGIGCRTGSPLGVDPATNESPAGRVIDQSSSSPTVAPDGAVLYGSYSRYNFARGHLWKFGSNGQFLAAFDFGWDTTPAIFQHDGRYSIVLKDNHYEANCCPGTGAPAPGPFFMTQLNSALGVEWQFKSTTIVKPDNPNGFEWCINAPAIDANGVVYANSEDGFVYAINQGGTLRQRIFLHQAIGAAYTPLAIGRSGLLYTENDGHLFVLGQ
jgi:outer membrane protein assembly factor BamB